MWISHFLGTNDGILEQVSKKLVVWGFLRKRVFRVFFTLFWPRLTGIKGATDQMLPWKAPNDPKTLPMGILHERMLCWPTLWPFRCCFGPFWDPCGYPNGPRVVQHDIKSCNIPMWSVLGSFGAFQGNIWSVAPFIPVRRGQKRVKKHEKRVFSKSPKLMIFSKPVPNYPHFPPKYG